MVMMSMILDFLVAVSWSDIGPFLIAQFCPGPLGPLPLCCTTPGPPEEEPPRGRSHYKTNSLSDLEGHFEDVCLSDLEGHFEDACLSDLEGHFEDACLSDLVGATLIRSRLGEHTLVRRCSQFGS